MNSNKSSVIAQKHVKKFGIPRIITREIGRISKHAYDQQYSVIYDMYYEYTRGRKVRFSSMRNEMYEI